MKRWVCLHGHFYQPPRENPWLETVECQDSAYPYHDWNERICAECYAPNAAARVLDGAGNVVRIAKNYSRLSFNFGQSLLSWLERRAPAVYAAVLEADRESLKRFSGHGSAMAQTYSHSILPLANQRDKRTEVRWGLADFEHRFGRKPEGMWLPEAAVDTATLEVLAEEGIVFVVLAPGQALAVRPIGGAGGPPSAVKKPAPWEDVSGGRIDPKRPYRVNLPSGGSITVFFYDGPVSRAVAFEGLLQRGDRLADRLKSAFDPKLDYTQLVHVATDGESYGHHHRFGEMALAHALDLLEASGEVRLTNYGEFLAAHPPTHEAKIVERSSWSCVHGIERWRSDCGCRAGGPAEWKQGWRAPLREALEWLRDRFTDTFRVQGAALFKDPWAARDAYIQLILDRSEARAEEFLARHAVVPVSGKERTGCLKLLEMERHSLLMFTSCGWFFNEISGIETAQIMRYAARALQLHRELTGRDVEDDFLERLSQARSNIAEKRDGRCVYERDVKPSALDPFGAAAYFGAESLFEPGTADPGVPAFEFQPGDRARIVSEKGKLSVGRVRVASRATLESVEAVYAFTHLGDTRIAGGAGPLTDETDYLRLKEELLSAFAEPDPSRLMLQLDSRFGSEKGSFAGLPLDAQRRVARRILEETSAEAEAAALSWAEKHAALARFLTGLGIPFSRPVRNTLEFSLNTRLRRCLEAPLPDFTGALTLIGEMKRASLSLHSEELAAAIRPSLQKLAKVLQEGPVALETMESLGASVELAREIGPVGILWDTENAFYDAQIRMLPDWERGALAGDEASRLWLERFGELGRKLKIQGVP